MSLECHNAFILHRRPYRETRQIVDLFCRNVAAGTDGFINRWPAEAEKVCH